MNLKRTQQHAIQTRPETYKQPKNQVAKSGLLSLQQSLEFTKNFCKTDWFDSDFAHLITL